MRHDSPRHLYICCVSMLSRVGMITTDVPFEEPVIGDVAQALTACNVIQNLTVMTVSAAEQGADMQGSRAS